MNVRCLLILLGLNLAGTLSAQPDFQPSITGLDALQSLDPAIKPRELRVLTPSLAPEELNRAVLNRLLQEIVHTPERAADTLALNDAELQNTTVYLSNARSFINNNESANLLAMCRAWDDSLATGDERIAEALDAYKQRRQLTLDFIERFYNVVIADIENALDEQSRFQFQRYLEDRRRRMANSGATSFGAVVENISSGRETVQSHCQR